MRKIRGHGRLDPHLRVRARRPLHAVMTSLLEAGAADVLPQAPHPLGGGVKREPYIAPKSHAFMPLKDVFGDSFLGLNCVFMA